MIGSLEVIIFIVITLALAHGFETCHANCES
jgi:hypothetical protein